MTKPETPITQGSRKITVFFELPVKTKELSTGKAIDAFHDTTHCMIEVIHVTKARGDDGQDFILRQTEKNHHMSHKSEISRGLFLKQ